MQPILAVTIPFFALVLAGYVAAQRRWLPESSIPGLNSFVLFFALPSMLLRFGMGLPVAQLIDPVVIGVYLLAALLIVFFTIAATWSARVALKDAAFGALVAAFPNTGFMGVPLLVALLGPTAAGPVMPTLLVDLFITSSLCIALAQSQPEPDAPSETGAGHAVTRALRGAATNPLPWAILLGGTLSALGLALPGPVDTIVGMLADAASPVALFTIGAVLWRAGQHSHTRTPVELYVPVALIKLFVHPLLVFALAASAQRLGFALDNFQILVLTLAAALPSASSVSLLAERYRADNGRIARIIVASTALSFISFSVLAWAFGVQTTP
jgi:malonate transporter and related proteins